MSKRKFTWNGVTYKSMKAAARRLGVSMGCIENRMRCGYTCDDDLHQVHRNPCTWNGIRYESVADAAQANYITRRAMAYRLKRGYTCDDDLAW